MKIYLAIRSEADPDLVGASNDVHLGAYLLEDEAQIAITEDCKLKVIGQVLYQRDDSPKGRAEAEEYIHTWCKWDTKEIDLHIEGHCEVDNEGQLIYYTGIY